MRNPKFLALLILASFLSACSSTNQPAAKPAAASGPAKTLVVWISVDGFRPSYLAAATDAPFLASLKKTGAWTEQLTPPYPSLTFASHTSEATGASPAVHGIPGNSFYDRKLDKEFVFPNIPSLLKAEPIWTAATRQGVRVAVYDWPFSQAETGPNAAAYFAEAYDKNMTDAGRLVRLDDVLKTDPATSLLMGYVEGVDHAGHDMGPAARAPVEQLERIDKLLAQTHAQAVETLKTKFPAGSRLYFLVSTDHGMAQVKTTVNLKAILKDVLPPNSHVITGGATGHVFVPDSPDKTKQLAAMREALAPYPFVKAYMKETLPPQWTMYDADRVGDLYIDMPAGYAFSTRGAAVVELASETTTRPADRGPRGMHSYDPAETPDMLGFTVVSRYPDDFGGIDLGKVDNRRLAPTVASWLGIAPPAQNQMEPLPQVTK